MNKQIRSMMNVNNVTIVSEATAPTSQSFPNKKLFALAGLVLGFLISYVYVLLRDVTDTAS
ncbi:GNVR domain-containing protein [Limosilactobacillus fermentum]